MMPSQKKFSLALGISMVCGVALGILYLSCRSANVPFIPCLLACLVGLVGVAVLLLGMWLIIRAFL